MDAKPLKFGGMCYTCGCLFTFLSDGKQTGKELTKCPRCGELGSVDYRGNEVLPADRIGRPVMNCVEEDTASKAMIQPDELIAALGKDMANDYVAYHNKSYNVGLVADWLSRRWYANNPEAE